MDRNRLVIVFVLLFTIVFGLSNAINSRKLVTNLDPNPNSSSNSNQDSPLSSPPPKPNLASVETPKLKDSPNTRPSNVKSKELTDTNNKTNSSDNKLDNGKKNVENQKQLQTFDSKRCNGNPICSDQKKTMTACIQDFENGSNKLTVTLLVQNDRDTDVKVKIMFGTSTNNNLPPFEIHGHKAEKVNITYSGDKSTKVILNAGNGDCELPITQPTLVKNPSKSENTENTSNTKNTPDHVDSPAKPKDVNTPVDSPPKVKEENDPSKVKNLDNPTKVKENDPSKIDPKEVEDPKNPKNIDPQEKPPKDVNGHSAEENLLHQLQLYSQKIEPIYGLYFGFLITVIIGGSWVFCLKRRRTDDVVPYQELEMGHPESSNAVEVETVEGWDQDWGDDDWDEDKAIRSSGGGVSKAISSNGLASRGTKKDGWDADWDD